MIMACGLVIGITTTILYPSKRLATMIVIGVLVTFASLGSFIEWKERQNANR